MFTKQGWVIMPTYDFSSEVTKAISLLRPYSSDNGVATALEWLENALKANYYGWFVNSDTEPHSSIEEATKSVIKGAKINEATVFFLIERRKLTYSQLLVLVGPGLTNKYQKVEIAR